jgi:hypothetical protein
MRPHYDIEESYSKDPQLYVRWHTVSLPPSRNQNAVLRFNLGAVTAFPLLRVDNDDARIRLMLDDLVGEIENFAREPLKDFLRSHLSRVTLNSDDLSIRLNYEIPLFRGNRLASPGEPALNPILKTKGWTRVA